jgi:predicted RNA-binding protein with PIN domain
MDAAPSFLIVDAHSMIFALDDLRRTQQVNPRLARDELTAALQSYQDATGVRVVVVFDGRGEAGEEPRTPGGIQVFYGGTGRSADAVIERLVARYASRFRLTVATNDRLEQTTVLAHGGEWIDAKRFSALLESARRDLRARIDRHRRRGSQQHHG